MGKSYNRRFRKNGLSFIVQDTHPADRKSDTDKYYLTVNKDGNLLHWIVSRPDASEETITVDSRNANQY